jgi:excisionase family DNA binding protein
MKIPEVAARLNVGRSTVYELIRKRQIATVHIGRSVRVHPSALDRLIETLSAEAMALHERMAIYRWR